MSRAQNMHRFIARSAVRQFSVKILGDDAAFASVHKSSGKKILYFTATWCYPCKMISGAYEKLSIANPGISFVKIDVDMLGAVAQEFSIRSVPTFIFMKDQTEIAKFSGASEDLLNKHIQELVKAV